MKLYEFHEKYYDGRSNTQMKRHLHEQPPAFSAAWVALTVLRDQRGFDDWWGRIKEPEQSELFEKLIKNIQIVL